jgi:hypothetical protein
MKHGLPSKTYGYHKFMLDGFEKVKTDISPLLSSHSLRFIQLLSVSLYPNEETTL